MNSYTYFRAELLEEFEDTENSEHKEWRKIFKSFHQTYDKVMKVRESWMRFLLIFSIETVTKENKKWYEKEVL